MEKGRVYSRIRLSCIHCGGEMDLSSIARYLEGYVAAGGNPDDVLRGFYAPAEGGA